MCRGQRAEKCEMGGSLDQQDNVPVLLTQAPVQSEGDGSSSESLCYLEVLSVRSSKGQGLKGSARTQLRAGPRPARAAQRSRVACFLGSREAENLLRIQKCCLNSLNPVHHFQDPFSDICEARARQDKGKQ